MKTQLQTTALLVILTVLFSISLSASIYNFTNEQYIDGTPFNTSKVYNNIEAEHYLPEFDFEEEEYIDDIPFDTKCIAANCLYNKALSVDYDFEDEAYIDDVPFDTRNIAFKCLYHKALLVEFNFVEEKFIMDIESSVINISECFSPEMVNSIISNLLATKPFAFNKY
ncbi:MAG: hypothetical protein H8E34_01715 [Bacteroidetes bacterium]|nr:hypothetical protein [Bacteroidota bacterium]MBL6944157.1 hypothetical protein [Bacteroidales bacterium]